MLRDKNLIPLSHQHQHALALCVRIERASPIPEINLPAWQEELTLLFRAEIGIHFAAEEQLVFPAAHHFEELAPLVAELLEEHTALRQDFVQAQEGALSSDELTRLSRQLSTHIRKEERQLFERMQTLLTPEQLNELGQRLEEALRGADETCLLPTEATRLRPSK
jgi:iron-sulfur cluster repair protein YtfE (RIC family)